MRRQSARTEDRDQPTSWQTREAQYDAACRWGLPDHSALQRLSAFEAPTFVANGDSDPMILPRYSHPQSRGALHQDGKRRRCG